MANQAKVVGGAVMYSDELEARIDEAALSMTAIIEGGEPEKASADAILIITAILGLTVQLDRIIECIEMLAVQGAQREGTDGTAS
ncbi:MAG: hypothetical protein V4510_12790 [bacterium]